MKTLSLDTNIIIRVFLADHPKLSPLARQLFKQAESGKYQLFLDDVIAAEVVWLMSSFHQFPRKKIVEKLKKLIMEPWIKCHKKTNLINALDYYRSTNLDYVDAWLYVISKDKKFKIASFDRDFDKLDSKIRHHL